MARHLLWWEGWVCLSVFYPRRWCNEVDRRRWLCSGIRVTRLGISPARGYHKFLQGLQNNDARLMLRINDMMESKMKAKNCNHGQLFFIIFFCFSFNINTNLFICLFIYFLSEKLAIQLLLKIRGEMKMIFIWSTLLGLVSTVYQEWSSRLIGRSSTKCCKWWLGTYLILFVFRNT